MEDKRVKQAMRGLWIVLVGAAIMDALRNDRDHGELFGFVPYDFRIPTADRAKRHAWSPSSKRILTPTTFGVGWGLNLGRLARLAHLV